MALDGENGSSGQKKAAWQSVRLPKGCSLRRTETFEYTTELNHYDLTLFQNQDGTWYAIALPRDSQRTVIYGSNTVDHAQTALQVVIDKIYREGLEAWTSQDSSDDGTQQGEDG